jgi:predicted RNase H-like HicB family nuclease
MNPSTIFLYPKLRRDIVLVYPVKLTPLSDGYLVTIPDCEINTSGKNLADAIFMARDAISLWCVCKEDAGSTLPDPSELSSIRHEANEILTLVDIDKDSYRRSLENRAIKKTLTIPSWLNERAEKSGINFSQLLQKAIKNELALSE